jgi:hypothetical protein
MGRTASVEDLDGAVNRKNFDIGYIRMQLEGQVENAPFKGFFLGTTN